MEHASQGDSPRVSACRVRLVSSPKNPLTEVAQILSNIYSPKIDNIVLETRGDFWREKGAKRWGNNDEGFLGLDTRATSSVGR